MEYAVICQMCSCVIEQKLKIFANEKSFGKIYHDPRVDNSFSELNLETEASIPFLPNGMRQVTSYVMDILCKHPWVQNYISLSTNNLHIV